MAQSSRKIHQLHSTLNQDFTSRYETTAVRLQLMKYDSRKWSAYPAVSYYADEEASGWMQLRFSCRSFLLAIPCSLVVTHASLRSYVSVTPEQLTGKTSGEYETNDPLYHCIHQLCSLLCFLLLLLSVSLHPKKTIFCRKRSCTIVSLCSIALVSTFPQSCSILSALPAVVHSLPCIMQ